MLVNIISCNVSQLTLQSVLLETTAFSLPGDFKYFSYVNFGPFRLILYTSNTLCDRSRCRPLLAQFRSLATANAHLCRRSDRSNFRSTVTFLKVMFCVVPQWKKSVDPLKTESVYISSSTNPLETETTARFVTRESDTFQKQQKRFTVEARKLLRQS